MTVEENDLRNGLIPEEHRLESPAQTKNVPRVEDTRSASHRLTGLYGYEPRAHQTGQDLFGGNERVLQAQPFLGRRCEHGWCPLADRVDRQSLGKSVGMR